MKLIIPSSGRSAHVQRALTLARCMGFEVLLVVREDEADAYRGFDPVVAPVGPGVTVIRKWAQENLVGLGEWYAQADDLLEEFRGPRAELYDKARSCNVDSRRVTQAVFDDVLSPEEVRRRFDLNIQEAERIGAAHVAFAPVENYFFRAKKHRHVGYCLGRTVLIRRDLSAQYDPEIATAMDDWQLTGAQLLAFGRVLIDNWILPVKKHYQPGGIGTYEERLPQKLADCRRIVAAYRGLFAYKRKAGCHPKAELRVRFNSTRQVEEWRRTLASRTQGKGLK